MTHEDERRHKIQVGQEAALLIDGEAGQEAFQRVEASIIARWKAADTVEKREAAFAQVRSLEEVREQLRRILADGQFEAEALRRSL